MRRLGFLTAVVGGVGFLLSPPQLRAQSGPDDHVEAPEVRRLVLRGVAHVDRIDLERSIATRASSCRNLFVQIFCFFTRSPTFIDKHHLHRDEFKRDVLRIRVYYYKRGYRNVEVDTSVTRDGPGVRVTFDIKENDPTIIRRIAIEYDSTLISERQRNKLTLLRAKDPLNLVMLDSMRVLFQNELWDRGYGDAVVDTVVRVDEAANLADVELHSTLNRRTTVGDIVITGTELIDQQTILNSISLRTGNLFRFSDVLESQRNLYESNLFRQATIVVAPQRDSVKRIQIAVVESPLHEVHVGSGLTNVDFAQFDGRYTAYNLFGGARRLDISGAMGNMLAATLTGRSVFRDIKADVPDTNFAPYLQPTWSASIDFKQPAFLHRPPNAAGFGVFAHRQSSPGVFIDHGYGGQATLTRIVSPRAPASLNYRFEINRVEASDVYFCVNYGVCDTLTIGSLRSHQSLSPLSLSGFIDRSDVPFSPTKGYVARLDLEHASSVTQSDYRYNRAFFDGAVYAHRPGTKIVYSGHLRMGFVRALAGGRGDIGVLHPRKRFYAGGAQSVRGYTENQLGPRILTIAPEKLIKGTTIAGAPCDTTSDAVRLCNPNSGTLGDGDFIPQPLGGTSLLEGSVELRVPLPIYQDRFVAAGFLDAAVVGAGSIQSLGDLRNITRGTGAVTPGIGIRYESPVGPIRFDMGVNPKVSERLAVVTSVVEGGKRRIVPLNTTRIYSPGGRTLLDRLTFHFSIGQAY
jgi:outer membrane protein insertion porin family/translocation and assembly module TamA